MMRFKADTTDQQKEACRAAIASLPDMIPEISSFAVGFNVGEREDNFDLGVVADFESRAHYDVYASHPDHVQVIQDEIVPVVAERAAVQYEH